MRASAGFFEATTKADGVPTVLRSAFTSRMSDVDRVVALCERRDAVDVLEILGVTDV